IDALRSYLERDGDIELAILFGSMATGSFTKKSDIDLAIKKHRPITAQQKIELIEQIALLTGRAVDLVDLSTVGEPLLGQVLKYGKRLLGSDAAYAEIGLQHVYAQADFVPYMQRTLEERRQKWLES
ncbi:MAG: nucleotidyltransferase domain-containing protein, partial [Idiomarina sp.]|nr:nucleotidyltransferase domain-containing protein [Idiomarina sp.]